MIDIAALSYPHRAVLTVDGMMCSHCKARVENAFGELPDTAAEVDLEKKTVTVMTKQPMTEAQLQAVIDELIVYTVEKIEINC